MGHVAPNFFPVGFALICFVSVDFLLISLAYVSFSFCTVRFSSGFLLHCLIFSGGAPPCTISLRPAGVRLRSLFPPSTLSCAPTLLYRSSSPFPPQPHPRPGPLYLPPCPASLVASPSSHSSVSGCFFRCWSFGCSLFQLSSFLWLSPSSFLPKRIGRSPPRRWPRNPLFPVATTQPQYGVFHPLPDLPQ